MNILIRTTAVTWLALVAAAPQIAIASEPGDDEGGSGGLNIIFSQSDNGLGGGGGGGISVPSVEDNFSMPDIGGSADVGMGVGESLGTGAQIGRDAGPAVIGGAVGAITTIATQNPAVGGLVGAITATSPVAEASGDIGEAIGAYTDETGNSAVLPGIESGHSPRPDKSVLDSMGDAISGAINSATRGERPDLGDVNIEQVLEPMVTPESIEDALSGPQMKSLDPSIKGGQLPISPDAFEDPDAPELDSSDASPDAGPAPNVGSTGAGDVAVADSSYGDTDPGEYVNEFNHWYGDVPRGFVEVRDFSNYHGESRLPNEDATYSYGLGRSRTYFGH